MGRKNAVGLAPYALRLGSVAGRRDRVGLIASSGWGGHDEDLPPAFP